ncbi:ATP-binding protein [Lipingzhangella sp. LS1_29]|uniref:ATP-binding protein n=1 Tax=Lipingzhangella rawalii TaxID=2055835 RepID=A0ABU2H626_9ACTN|nr:ATP-binding protein [Lipingzhangella rawalii]MDS1270762.1 ATP-binding protein [Lipingzhangella rawalii]
MSTVDYPATVARCFAGTRDSVPQARAWLGRTLAKQGVTRSVGDDAALVLSELATNAATHTRSAGPFGSYTVRVDLTQDRLVISVEDAGGPHHPHITTPDDLPDPLTESGRGLAMVALYATRWWTTGNSNGRTITAELATS